MTESTSWGSSFAAASTDAMSAYDDVLVPRLFTPWAQLLLDEIEPRPGEHALDVACGPGTVTRLLAERLGRGGLVVGCDLSPAMLEVASSKPPVDGAPIVYRNCGAEALEVEDSSFDVVTCQQGLQFFPDKPQALKEMRRAARDGARIAIAVWGPIESCPAFEAAADALKEVLGEDAAASYKAGPWGFGDGSALAKLVSEAGFEKVSLRIPSLPVVFEGGPEQFLQSLAAAPVGQRVAELDADGRVRLQDAYARATKSLVADGILRSHATSNVVVAQA